MADISITAASFVPNADAVLLTGVAGGTLTRGMPVYYDAASNTYKQLDVTNTSKDTMAGLCCDDVAVGQPVIIMRSGTCTLGGTVSSGDTVWCSATGLTKTVGDLTAGWRIIVAGVCTGASNAFYLNPTRGGVK